MMERPTSKCNQELAYNNRRKACKRGHYMEKAAGTPLDPYGVYEKLRTVAHQQGRVCFVFGAGASFGYSRLPNQGAPPVVAGLFDDTVTVVNKVLSRHEFIQRRRNDIQEELIEHGGDLESYLGHLYKLHPNNELFTRLILYMQDVCALASETIDADRETNNYLRLIYRMESLRGADWSCITFNYDTILERTFMAVGSASRTFANAHDYDLGPKIIKVHGGINFRYQFQETDQPVRTMGNVFDHMMAHSSEAKDASIYCLPMSDAIPISRTTMNTGGNRTPARRLGIYNYPAMMVPIHNTNNTHNQFFQSAVDRALQEIHNAKIVIAIGYNFGDKIFVDGMRKLDLSGKEMLVVSGSDFSDNPTDCPAYNELSNFWSGPLYLFRGAKFASFVNSIGPTNPKVIEQTAHT